MRIQAGILAVVGAIALPATAAVPTASADGQCRTGYSLYDTGVPGGFPEDHNLNGLVCSKYKQLRDGTYRAWYTDDR